MLLNDTTVSTLRLPSGKTEARFFDDELTGFGVRIRDGGKRTWIVQARFAGQQRTITVGTVGTLREGEARKAAKKKLAMIELEQDPQAEKKNARDASERTLAKLTPIYLEWISKAVRPATKDAIERSLTEHWSPLRSKPIDRITKGEIAARLTVIARERGPIAANRARSYLSSFYAWAIGEAIVDENPVRGTNRNEEAARERVLINTDLAKDDISTSEVWADLADVWNSCGDDDYGRIVRLLILTGQRKNEVALIDRAEVNLKARRWSLPAARTKNGKPHDVPLSDAAIKILRVALDAAGEREKIFGRAGSGFSGWSKAKAALDARIAKARDERGKRAKPMAPWTLHDLRRSAATGLAMLGVLPHVIESCLNHISGHKAGIGRVYILGTYENEKRQALDLWAAHVMALAEGKRSNVVAIERTRGRIST